MAIYKQPCMHCGALLARDARLCSACGSRSPFGCQCPGCLKPIMRGEAVCSGCGRALVTTCFYCGQPTFAGSENCDACGRTLLLRCENKRCQQPQFFENASCTVCGKPMKKARQQMKNLQKGV